MAEIQPPKNIHTFQVKQGRKDQKHVFGVFSGSVDSFLGKIGFEQQRPFRSFKCVLNTV